MKNNEEKTTIVNVIKITEDLILLEGVGGKGGGKRFSFDLPLPTFFLTYIIYIVFAGFRFEAARSVPSRTEKVPLWSVWLHGGALDNSKATQRGTVSVDHNADNSADYWLIFKY